MKIKDGMKFTATINNVDISGIIAINHDGNSTYIFLCQDYIGRNRSGYPFYVKQRGYEFSYYTGITTTGNLDIDEDLCKIALENHDIKNLELIDSRKSRLENLENLD
jgi:hypothetical protein